MGKTTKTYNHIFIPKHEKLSEKQKQDVLKEYGCTEDQLPRIKISDPAIADSSPKPGDMFRITRKTKPEAAIFYRVVAHE